MSLKNSEKAPKNPNIIFIFADQLREQALGYTGDPNVITPNIDKLADEGIVFTNAISGLPVCSPYRASLLTGTYPLTHGIFVNDVPLNPEMNSIAKEYKKHGYNTAYIGKWHIDGSGSRSAIIPKERRQGFDFWDVLECTHNYNESFYWNNNNEKKKWKGYDAIAQTDTAIEYIKNRDSTKPFLLFLSWGPPHDPYFTAPDRFRNLYQRKHIQLRANVPKKFRKIAQKSLSGYYAHVSALDECVGNILNTIEECGIEQNTILAFTSDHGDMHYSQGEVHKQRPWEESIKIPLIIKYPELFKVNEMNKNNKIDIMIDAPDLMPTFLGLCNFTVSDSVEGRNLSSMIVEKTKLKTEKAENLDPYKEDIIGKNISEKDALLIMCISPFAGWRKKHGGREYRGIRTQRYTYVRDLNGPWLLYDNISDPFQIKNRCNDPQFADIRLKLEEILFRKLKERNDEFKPGKWYLEKYGYKFDPNTDAVPYKD